MSSSCQLCAEPGPIATRNYGLDLCEPCSAGYVAGRLGAFEATLAVEELEVTDSRTGDTRRVLHVTASIPRRLPVVASFARSTLGSRIRHMFDAHRFRSGDPLLDARVIIRTRTPQLLRPLLANDGFQSAVMSLVSSCEQFELRPGNMDIRANLDDLDLRADVPLAVAALLRHIANAT